MVAGPVRRWTRVRPLRPTPVKTARAALVIGLVALIGPACGSTVQVVPVATPSAAATDVEADSTAASPAGVATSLEAPTAAALSQAQRAQGSVWMTDLTWPQVDQRIDQGWTTVIVPTGGVEQNGRHLALDKHNVVVTYTAEQIARQVGATLVAPVLAYVPEGDPAVMDDHLRWAGTISVTPDVFGQVLASTARSLAGHGFTTIVFLGDSGSSQATQSQIAAEVSAGLPVGVRVVNLDRYWGANGQRDLAAQLGFSSETIGTHAGLLDTSEVLALAPELVDGSQLFAGEQPGSLDVFGVDGDPAAASAELGQRMLELKIAAGVAQLREVTAGSG